MRDTIYSIMDTLTLIDDAILDADHDHTTFCNSMFEERGTTFTINSMTSVLADFNFFIQTPYYLKTALKCSEQRIPLRIHMICFESLQNQSKFCVAVSVCLLFLISFFFRILVSNNKVGPVFSQHPIV
jgi:hypothetical protein